MTNRSDPPRASSSRDASSLAAVDVVHDTLRAQILQGTRAPGVVISQAQLARDLGVSRSPVREACRLLEREGLVDARHNQRVKVADLSLRDLEELYASRIVLETLAISMQLPELSVDDLAGMETALVEMTACAADRDYDRFAGPHAHFHSILLHNTGHRLSRQIRQLAEHSQRYRRIYLTQLPTAWDSVLENDTRILAAIRAGDFGTAVEGIARHLASTALAMVALKDPTYEPSILRAALHLVGNTPYMKSEI